MASRVWRDKPLPQLESDLARDNWINGWKCPYWCEEHCPFLFPVCPSAGTISRGYCLCVGLNLCSRTQRKTAGKHHLPGLPPTPHSLVGKESVCNAGDPGSIPGSERSPGEGKGYPLQYSGLENSMDCIVHGVAKSWTQLSDFHFHCLIIFHFFLQWAYHYLTYY